ncbi:MAG TPA: hypothetical protein ENI17_13870 [Pseudomonas xinjiangensis]|uniref:Type 4 fimbrial biogenesis protein PilX N-terminal domain-containing protein n=2 Tax=root TaxID=1 RepID=A0A7V1BP92_9GAMM|nr:hypothetical protein [Halopseudomonas xinjiangensis]HEC48695.1 hypothetical protein [Halopseudomonas xinjiangensis]
MRKTLMPRVNQRGSVLLICLILLLAMTFLGVSAMSNSTMQERIVGGARDQNVAFQAAEAALRVGELMAQDVISEVSEYPELRPADAVNCVIGADDWKAPAGLKRAPSTPTCTVTSYYAALAAERTSQSDLLDAPEICIETGEAAGPGGASACHQDSPRGLLFKVDAEGFGSTGASATLRSTYVVIKDIE